MGVWADRGIRNDGGRRLRRLLSAVLAGPVLFGASTVAAQQMAGSALVRIPPVAHMEVESVAAASARTASSPTRVEGSFRIQVRANQGWEIAVAAAPASGGAGTLWVRASGRDGGGEFRQVEPGADLAVASGGMGEAVIRLDYRWESGESGTPVAPLTYTLASR